MDKKTEIRYKKILKDENKIEEKIKGLSDELELLKMEESEIAGAEIVAIRETKHISLLDIIKKSIAEKNNNIIDGSIGKGENREYEK